MADHCQSPHCVVPSDEGCGAGESDHRECHHWQIGQLRNERQKYREILLELVGVDDVRSDVLGMLSLWHGMQQTVRMRPGNAQSVAATIRALEFLRDTEPEYPYGMALNDVQKIMLNDAQNLAMLVRRLAAKLKKIAPNDDLAGQAMEYVRRLGFESPWRDASHV